MDAREDGVPAAKPAGVLRGHDAGVDSISPETALMLYSRLYIVRIPDLDEFIVQKIIGALFFFALVRE
jgi:hypothetical protein